MSMRAMRLSKVATMTRQLRGAVGLLGLVTLSGCISFGAEPPERLLTLTPASSIAAGTGVSGAPADALAVVDIRAPQRLDVNRVPVQTSDSTLAYLKDAQWVEKPAILFERLLAETIRARGNRLVLEGPDAEFAARTRLTGQLTEMGYDALTGSVVVTYDAMLVTPSGEYRTQRFSRSVGGVAADADAVAPVLNDAANEVAAEVAAWVG